MVRMLGEWDDRYHKPLMTSYRASGLIDWIKAQPLINQGRYYRA